MVFFESRNGDGRFFLDRRNLENVFSFNPVYKTGKMVRYFHFLERPLLAMAEILRSVIKNRMLVTPAPTAASVIARSGDSSMSHMTDIIELYPIWISTAESRFFVNATEAAHRIRKPSKKTML
jgi:hypothetical protein